jgi:phosphopentomutase
LISTTAFPTYPNGFPPEIIEQFISKTGCAGVLANKAASGTEILTELGEEHQRTGFPIVYTSGDSVFQIACHTDIVPLAKLYDWCLIARQILQPPNGIGRVIARPFNGKPESYKRLQGDRRDFSVSPGTPTLLDHLVGSGMGVLGIGKIEDIFAAQGISYAKHTASNEEGLKLTLDALNHKLELKRLALGTEKAPNDVQIIFTNLVDTDSLFGHRRDVAGYARSLMQIDSWLATFLPNLKEDDLLIISSDHGNDPTAPGTDHTREYVPLLIFSPAFLADKPLSDTGSSNLGVRQTFADVACTIAQWLDFSWTGPGVSCLKRAL